VQDFVEQPARYLATVEELLTAERMHQAADLLRSATPKIERTGFDNWNGGTEQWTVYLAVDPVDFALLGAAKGGVEEQIAHRLKAVLEPFTGDWYSVTIVPRLAELGAAARPNARVRRQTRLNIIDGLRIDNVAWFGKLDDVDFSPASTICRRCNHTTPDIRMRPATFTSTGSTISIGLTTGSMTTCVSDF
jgi:hypothetical protein